MNIYKINDAEYPLLNLNAEKLIQETMKHFPEVYKQAIHLLSTLGLDGLWKGVNIALAEIITQMLNVRQDIDNALTDKIVKLQEQKSRRNIEIADLKHRLKEAEKGIKFNCPNCNSEILAQPNGYIQFANP